MKITVDDFLLSVYEWLMKPMNRNVEDLHDSYSRYYGKVAFTKEMEKFMEGRFIQTYPNEPIDDDFIHKCAVEYTKEYYA